MRGYESSMSGCHLWRIMSASFGPSFLPTSLPTAPEPAALPISVPVTSPTILPTISGLDPVLECFVVFDRAAASEALPESGVTFSVVPCVLLHRFQPLSVVVRCPLNLPHQQADGATANLAGELSENWKSMRPQRPAASASCRGLSRRLGNAFGSRAARKAARSGGGLFDRRLMGRRGADRVTLRMTGASILPPLTFCRPARCTEIHRCRFPRFMYRNDLRQLLPATAPTRDGNQAKPNIHQ